MKQWLKQEAALLWCAGGILLMSAIYILLNLADTHYHGCHYQLRSMLPYMPWGVGVLFISVYLRRFSAWFTERLSLFFDTVGKLYWVYLLSAIGCFAIQFTPFHLIDASLLHFEQSLGFSSSAVYSFTVNHHWLDRIAHFSYESISFQIFAIPLLLAFLLEKRSLRLFFIANLIAVLIAYNIYYFFPTTVPAHVLPQTNFSTEQYGVVAQWYEIHLHLKNYIHVGDLIGFPSFHVIWSVLVTYACRNRKWLFYPLILLNIFLIASTMELGWHFLTDVLGGLGVAAISIYIAALCVPNDEKRVLTLLKA